MTSLLNLSNLKWLALAIVTALLLITKSQLDAEKAQRKLDAQTYATEQANAALNLEKAKNELEKRYEVKAEQADATLQSVISGYSNAIRMRSKASESTSSRPEDTGASTSSTVLDGPGEGTKLLISGEDAYICAVNTARLQVSREWALKLNNDN